MHSDPLDSSIEIKNENLPTLKACSLDFCKRLVHLNLSMNNISIVDGGFECANLKTLILSDNLIKDIKPSMLLKLPALRVLNLDMNQISRIQNISHLTELLDLSIMQNKVTQIEGISTLTKLRKLNLSFNRIQKLEGLSTLQMLEVLELGKNQI